MISKIRTGLRSRYRAEPRDGGNSLVELLVAMGLAVLLGAIGVGAMNLINRTMVEHTERVEQWAGLRNASGQLTRDVDEAVSIRIAEPQRLTVAVVRLGVCNLREYVADPVAGTLTVATVFFAQEACEGPSERSEKVLVSARYTQTATFSYLAETLRTIDLPITDFRAIALVRWSLVADPYSTRTDALPLEMSTAAAFDGVGETPGTDEPFVHATAPLLEIVTVVPGRDHPVLRWTDLSPTATTMWTVYRAMQPEVAGDLAIPAWTPIAPWTPIMNVPKDPNSDIYTWTDLGVPDGYVAIYLVAVRTIHNQSGPESNVVVAGKRPAAPTTVTATGAPTTIAVTWSDVIGATSYDVYRDDALVATLGDVLTWTDPLTYGHSHTYRVVAVNRFEQKLSTGSEDGRIPIGSGVTAASTFVGGARILSAAMVSAGAFTAPAALTLTATPNDSWQNVVTRTYAPWVGAGPTSKAGVSRDRGWVTEGRTLAGTFSALWGETAAATQTHTSRPGGRYAYYQAQACNASGCSPWSGTSFALQRPATPTCTTGAISTRGMTVTVNPAATDAGTNAFSTTGGVGAPTGTGVQAAAPFVIDQLTHGTGNTFTVKTENTTGWSDPATCAGTTLTLGVGITSASSTTRSITASMATANGNASSLTLEFVRSDANVTTSTWDPLTHGTDFLVTARNSDGWNDVAVQISASTQTLTAAAPSCSLSGGGEAPGGWATINASGGTGDYEYSPAHYRTGLNAGTYTGSARTRNTDGWNTVYSGWVGCGSVTVTPPPPPVIPAGYTTTFPSGCTGGGTVSPGSLEGTWLSNFSANYFKPSPFILNYKVNSYDGDGKPISASWGINAEKKVDSQPDWTGGIWTCEGQVGV
ncbi:hypothetical protein [Cellulomonas sp. KRMCY2]|uniref:hypothetical protein n=1 Tax=Cellulomonas sp. KRMCY2 TaxID=1304865 RepID=UPI00045EB782|nr:hypothetical protein [Cellulomonas sp. KRMCY2]